MPHQKLVARLQAVTGIRAEDRAMLEALQYTTKSFSDGQLVVRLGDRPQTCTIVVSGFLARQRVLDCRNHISAFYIPGDIANLHTLHLPVMDNDLRSVGRATMAFIAHANLRETLSKSVTLTNAFWRETMIHGAILRQWVDNSTGRKALPRVAHLLCEIAFRLDVVDLSNEGNYHFPLSQQDVADACGLSTVHVNRVIQDLRRQDFIDWTGRTLRILRRRQLEELAEFSASYLEALTAGTADVAPYQFRSTRARTPGFL
jgi:CRP-like cAMP-binding protein